MCAIFDLSCQLSTARQGKRISGFFAHKIWILLCQMPSEAKMMMVMVSQSFVDRLDQVRSGKWNGLEGDLSPLQWVICDIR